MKQKKVERLLGRLSESPTPKAEVSKDNTKVETVSTEKAGAFMVGGAKTGLYVREVAGLMYCLMSWMFRELRRTLIWRT